MIDVLVTFFNLIIFFGYYFLYSITLGNLKTLVFGLEVCASSGSVVRAFRPYNTGRVLKFAFFAKFKTEGRDRSLARAGPTAGAYL